MPLKLALFVLLAVALLISVVTDLSRRRIYDLVTIPTAVGGLGLRAYFEGLGSFDSGVISGLLGAALALALFGSFALVNKGFGWGDTKLATAAGACFGMPLALAALVFISLAGALQAIVTLIWQGAVSDSVKALVKKWMRKGEGATQRHIPYGVAIALGSFWAMWWDWGGAGGTP